MTEPPLKPWERVAIVMFIAMATIVEFGAVIGAIRAS